ITRHQRKHTWRKERDEPSGEGRRRKRQRQAHFGSPVRANQGAKSERMKSLVPGRPASFIHISPCSRARLSSMSKNGQQDRSPLVHSVNAASVAQSLGKRKMYP